MSHKMAATAAAEKVEVADESGFTLKMQRLPSGRFTGEVFNADFINNFKAVKMRDDDILFVSYAKSGCHWVWNNVRMLSRGEIVHDAVDKESSMMEVLDRATVDALPSPRLLNTHTFFDNLPEDVLKGKVKVIHLYRNPKDIAVSFYHHHKRLKYYGYQGEFSHYIKRFAKGLVTNNNVFDFWQGWEEGLAANPQIPCHIVSFEQFKLDPIGERRRLAEFLGVQCSDEFLQELKDATDINVMKPLKGSTVDSKGESVFYRKGEIGDWKNYFTPEENQWFDQIIQSRMGSSKMFTFIYSENT